MLRRVVRMNGRGKNALPDAVRRQRTCRFTDRPFARMHAIRAARDVRRSDVLARHDEIGAIGGNE
jgi:hypothetical protein